MFWQRQGHARVVTRGAEWFVLRNGLIAEIRSDYRQEPEDSELDGFPYARSGYSVHGSERSRRHAPMVDTRRNAMNQRVTSELLLVGSLPADSTDAALRAGGELFGDMVFALPDGETGPRAAWVGYEREQLVPPNPRRGVGEGTGVAHRHPRAADEK